MSVEKGWEEMGVGVKCQPNPEIAGSPRNCLRASLGRWAAEVEHRWGKGPERVTASRRTANAAVLSSGVRR